MTDDQINESEQEVLLELCSSIQQWQKFSYGNGDASLNWDWPGISGIMLRKGHTMSASECCKRWKYLAYGKTYKSQDPLEVPSDDDEAYYQPLTAYKRFKKNDPSEATNPDIKVQSSLQKQAGELPSAARVRLSSRKIKFLVPEQIPTGSSNMHVPVFNGEHAFDPVKKLLNDPPPLVSAVCQSNPAYKQYQEEHLFSRPYAHRPLPGTSFVNPNTGSAVSSAAVAAAASSAGAAAPKKNYYMESKALKEKMLAMSRLNANTNNTTEAPAAATAAGAAAAVPMPIGSTSATSGVPRGFLPVTQLRPALLPTAVAGAIVSAGKSVGSSSTTNAVNAGAAGPATAPSAPPSAVVGAKRRTEEIKL